MIDKMRSFASEITNNKDPSLMGLIPFYLPKMFPLVERFVYMESDVVLQVILYSDEIILNSGPIYHCLISQKLSNLVVYVG
jgi:hypothetical protein